MGLIPTSAVRAPAALSSKFLFWEEPAAGKVLLIRRHVQWVVELITIIDFNCNGSFIVSVSFDELCQNWDAGTQGELEKREIEKREKREKRRGSTCKDNLVIFLLNC